VSGWSIDPLPFLSNSPMYSLRFSPLPRRVTDSPDKSSVIVFRHPDLLFASEGDLLALVSMFILIAKRSRISGENKF
jgi:hypothetical protein